MRIHLRLNLFGICTAAFVLLVVEVSPECLDIQVVLQFGIRFGVCESCLDSCLEHVAEDAGICPGDRGYHLGITASRDRTERRRPDSGEHASYAFSGVPGPE